MPLSLIHCATCPEVLRVIILVTTWIGFVENGVASVQIKSQQFFLHDTFIEVQIPVLPLSLISAHMYTFIGYLGLHVCKE